MDEELKKVYQALKRGPAKGVVINSLAGDPVISNTATDYAVAVHNAAINSGFAEKPTEKIGYGSEVGLRLSWEGRQYPTYEAFCDRHRKSDFNISNSVVGNNNAGIIQGCNFHASSITNTATHQLMTVSEQIDQILHDAEEGYAAHPTRGSSNEYEKASAKVLRHGLVKPISKSSYELTLEGERAIELGGFDNWKKLKEHQELQRHANIHISGGNAVIGSNNSSVVQGQEGALINTGNDARIESHIEVKKGSFETLAQKLSESGISQQDIEELKSILKSDNPNKEKGIFGDKTNGWISKMIGKSLDGTWQIGVGAAGGLLVEVIKTFYGWP